MCAMSPDWPTLSAFQLPCFCNSKVVASSNLGLELANAFGVGLAENRRWLGREPALAWPRTGVGLAENWRWLGPAPGLAWPRNGGRPSKPLLLRLYCVCSFGVAERRPAIVD